VSKDGISSNWLYSSSSTTFSIPTILFLGITTNQFFFQSQVHRTLAQHRWRRQMVRFCNQRPGYQY
jgi:hypothetical protein